MKIWMRCFLLSTPKRFLQVTSSTSRFSTFITQVFKQGKQRDFRKEYLASGSRIAEIDWYTQHEQQQWMLPRLGKYLADAPKALTRDINAGRKPYSDVAYLNIALATGVAYYYLVEDIRETDSPPRIMFLLEQLRGSLRIGRQAIAQHESLLPVFTYWENKVLVRMLDRVRDIMIRQGTPATSEDLLATIRIMADC